MRALMIQHDHICTPGFVGERFVDRGYDLRTHQVVSEGRFRSPNVQTQFPEPTDFDVIISMGAPWSVYDHDAIGSWVLPELAMLRSAHHDHVPVFGICFGGQLLAAAHGGSVARSATPEIGWVEIESDEESLVPAGEWFQWHYDSWELPAEATELARNPSSSQAFILGQNLAVQFHPEMSSTILASWIATGGAAEIGKQGINIETLIRQTAEREVSNRDRAHRLVDLFLDHVAVPSEVGRGLTHDSGHSFRHAAGRFASGVTVVTTRATGGAYGVTVSSFASLSLNPLLVTVSINRSSPLLGYVRSAEAFAVSVLASDQQQVAEYFAMRGRTPEPAGFPGVRTTTRQTSAPIIDGCLSWFDCTVEDLLPGGDHEILVGRVAAAGGRTGEPLVYWAGGYRALTAEASQSDRLANASDGLAVAYHLLDVGPEELLDAQSSVEPALAAFAASRTPAEEWDRLEELVDQSERVIEQPDEFNQLALAFHNAIAEASRNRVLQATLASLGQVQSIHYRDRGSPESARAAVEGHRRLLAVLRSGDAEAARDEMDRHLLAVRGQLQIG